MNFRKIVLYLIAAIIGVALWSAWQHDYPQTAATTAQPTASNNSTSVNTNSSAPAPFVNNQQSNSQPSANSTNTSVAVPNANIAMSHSRHWINVKTDVLNLMIDPQGGSIVGAALPKYPVSVQQKNTPIQIFSPDQDNIYVAQSDITSRQHTKPVVYRSVKQTYQLASGQKQLRVALIGSTSNGLRITKILTFVRGSYAINVSFNIKNVGSEVWNGSVYNQFTRRNVPIKRSFHSRSYDGAAISTSDVPYDQVSFEKLAEQNIDQTVKKGWIAMQQPYFVSAWVPQTQQVNRFYSTSEGNGDDGKYNVFRLGYVSPQISLQPMHTFQSRSTLYVGPELASQLSAVAPHLNLTINYGWLAPISMLIFVIMKYIHSIVGNWGWSIVLVTVFIKIIFYPFSAKSLKSMAKLRLLQPKFAALKERHGDDKQAIGKATMEIYKKEKVNPMSGCLPMIIQIPVFFALYYVLIESVQLRQAPFIFWIHDLSVKDPYYVLPILMGISMFVQQKMNPPPPDPTQAKMMMFLPVIFTVFFLSFPAGLVLYWLTNNCVQTLHQWYVMKTFDPKKEQYKQRQKKKKK